jgi:hypothetical protein
MKILGLIPLRPCDSEGWTGVLGIYLSSKLQPQLIQVLFFLHGVKLHSQALRQTITRRRQLIFFIFLRIFPTKMTCYQRWHSEWMKTPPLVYFWGCWKFQQMGEVRGAVHSKQATANLSLLCLSHSAAHNMLHAVRLSYARNFLAFAVV